MSSAAMDTERVIKNSITLSNRLISGIEADLRDVHEMIHSNDKDTEDKQRLYHTMRQENIEIRQQVLELQRQIEQERVQHRNEEHYRAMELEEQRQSYEGEITRVLAMYKQSEENRGFVSGQASSGLERIRELEDRLAASEAQRGELSGAVKHLQQENEVLRADIKRNESFHSVMEASYMETVERCKMLQQSLDSLETKYKDELKQTEMDCYRLKERNRYLERRQNTPPPKDIFSKSSNIDDSRDIVDEYNRLSMSGFFGAKDDQDSETALPNPSRREAPPPSKQAPPHHDYRSTLSSARAASHASKTRDHPKAKVHTDTLPTKHNAFAESTTDVGDQLQKSTGADYEFDIITLAALNDYDTLPGTEVNAEAAAAHPTEAAAVDLGSSTRSVSGGASWRRAPPKPPTAI